MKTRLILRLCISAALWMLLMPALSLAEEIPIPLEASSQQASLPKAKSSGSSSRLWNLQDADILSVINEVSQETGKNFVVDPRVNGKITLISSKPLRKSEVYQVFLSVLSMIGYSAIPSGNVIKIVPNMESGELATKVSSQYSPGKGDEVVVRIIPLTNVTAAQLIPVIRPLLPQWSNISAYNPGNILILLGRASNMDRILDIIRDVDKASNSNIEVIPLRYASASQVATVLTNLQSASRSAGEPANVSIAVDERSNSILIGGPKMMRLKMRALVSRLDGKSASSSGNTEVVYLRYLQAKTFAPTLSKIAENMAGKGGSSHSAAPASAPSTGGASGKPASSQPEELGTLIQAEPNSNAIVITAPPAQMKALKEVIAKLDIRPAQVLVEAIIAELDESDLTSLGIQWGSVNADASVAPIVTGTPTSFPNLGAGVVGIIPYIKIQAILSVLRNQNGVNILSTPSLVVLDNQKATIEVGEDVPVTTGSYATTGGTNTVAPFNTNDYKKVTLKMDVTPQINLGNSIRLKIALKNDTLQNPLNPTLTPRINTSSINNSVIINSEDVLVLGGLISNTDNQNVNKVPILSSIPFIGAAFTQKTSSQKKKNLMVFIKPIIMESGNEGLRITEAKYAAMRQAQANFRDELDEIGDKPLQNRLPPLPGSKDLPTPFEAA